MVLVKVVRDLLIGLSSQYPLTMSNMFKFVKKYPWKSDKNMLVKKLD